MMWSNLVNPPIYLNAFKGGRNMVDKTKVEMDYEATQMDYPQNLFREEKFYKKEAFVGWLAIIDGNQRGEAFHLFEGRNVIGSSSNCDIQLIDEGIQDQHMSIRYVSKKWMLTDFDTDRGTFLNGRRIYRAELKDGDRIKIGEALVQLKIL